MGPQAKCEMRNAKCEMRNAKIAETLGQQALINKLGLDAFIRVRSHEEYAILQQSLVCAPTLATKKPSHKRLVKPKNSVMSLSKSLVEKAVYGKGNDTRALDMRVPFLRMRHTIKYALAHMPTVTRYFFSSPVTK